MPQLLLGGDRFFTGIINDILDISKIQAGKVVVETIRVDPLEMVNEVAQLMRVRTDAKALQLNVEFVGGIPQIIHTDPAQLRQIRVNLVGNAVKFTEVGSIELTVRLVSGEL